MQSVQRALLVSACSLVLLSACDAGISESSSGLPGATGADNGGAGPGSANAPGGLGNGGPAAPAGTGNTVTATPSIGGTVSVAVGASETITVTFNSSDGRPVRGLAISDTTLPAGWSGIDEYSCTQVDAGNSCVVNLTYSPTAPATGSVKLNYIYIDDANDAQAPGQTLVIPYSATAHNNVVASASPAGEIRANPGDGAASLSINFTTDDGNAATALSMATDLTALPRGWSARKPAFACAIVSTGSGCQLSLDYAPGAATSGTLALAYTYADDSGAPRSGILNIPYSSTAAGSVVATVAPTGQVNAVEKTGRQSVAITFTTADGRPASDLQLSGSLQSLPAGWSTQAVGLTCGSVSTGNGCQLTLSYAPVVSGRGTLTLLFDYFDATGTYSVGSVNIPYASTTNDNVVGTASPSGQINAIVGMGSQPVAITFTSDDSRPATALRVTSDLTALPGGWSSTSSPFACSGLSSGSGCQLSLMYAPPAAGTGTGTLTLAYSYVNNSGQAKTGSLNIAYRATTDNNVVTTANPSPVSVSAGTMTPVTVTFTTDDGNPATGLAITSGLSALPAGWSSTASTFTCLTLSVGTGCQLPLTYAPAAPDSGTLLLGYSYTNDSGSVKSGTVSLGYTATP